MKSSIILLGLIFTGLYLNAQINGCLHTKTNWDSAKDAIVAIENTSFRTSEAITDIHDSWLKSANYYSCNSDFGFLIVRGEKKTFVHQNVPVDVWLSLKSANSKGGYYNFYVKNKYKLLQKESDISS